MSENKQGNKFSLNDLEEIRNLFHSIGYAVVNDFEIPDDELGFDITGNEVLQDTIYQPPVMTLDDLTEIERFLNGSGYSVVPDYEDNESEKVESNLSEGSFFDSHMGLMAFMRTCTSAIASVISTIVLMKVW